MPLLLDYINHTDGTAHVDCGVVLSGLRGVHQCTSPAVLDAVDALKAACRQELSGKDAVGGTLGMAVEARPTTVVAETVDA